MDDRLYDSTKPSEFIRNFPEGDNNCRRGGLEVLYIVAPAATLLGTSLTGHSLYPRHRQEQRSSPPPSLTLLFDTSFTLSPLSPPLLPLKFSLFSQHLFSIFLCSSPG
ncbi:hypothetical protein E2C01_059790 [Portunus trituberculatus]|uniref:Uncharacterized protein n=1 Tax=Portunus trituberculatus TaxID=210409 RepID=A0A5B7H3K2_PORTR|nr:hypothetical protein [Portunus trituberculatus]